MARNSVSHFPRLELALRKNKYTQPHTIELLKIPERIWITDMNKIKVLLIEDDRSISNFITATMDREGYKIMHALNGREGLSLSTSFCPNVILLDLGLPDMDGLEVLQKLRSWSDVPVIIISARTKEQEKVSALDLGADDYITKPFNPPILLARIGVVLKRTTDKNAEKSRGNALNMEYKGVILNVVGGCIEHEGKKIDLTKNELKILHLLYQKKGEIVPRLDMIEYLWDNEVFIDDNTLSVNVTRLRGKLADIGVTDFIETKRGMGYRI